MQRPTQVRAATAHLKFAPVSSTVQCSLPGRPRILVFILTSSNTRSNSSSSYDPNGSLAVAPITEGR